MRCRHDPHRWALYSFLLLQPTALRLLHASPIPLAGGEACFTQLTHRHLVPHIHADLAGSCVIIIIIVVVIVIVTSGDDDLVTWTKVDVPVIPLPPPNMPLAGWRDPVVVACRAGSPSAATSLVDSTTDEWVCLIGSGLMGQGGTALVYSASNLTAGPWRFEGELCHGDGTTGQ